MRRTACETDRKPQNKEENVLSFKNVRTHKSNHDAQNANHHKQPRVNAKDTSSNNGLQQERSERLMTRELSSLILLAHTVVPEISAGELSRGMGVTLHVIQACAAGVV